MFQFLVGSGVFSLEILKNTASEILFPSGSMKRRNADRTHISSDENRTLHFDSLANFLHLYDVLQHCKRGVVA